MNTTFRHFSRYAVALFFVAAAFSLRFVIEKLTGPGLPTFITYYPAIMFSALLAGLGPGLWATAISVLLTDYFVFSPHILGYWDFGETAAIILFTGMGIFISLVAQRYNRIRDRLETLVDERTSNLHRAKLEWERTFDSVPDLIAIIDKQHRITRVNKAMAEHLGVAPQECIGLSCYAAIHGCSFPPAFCPHTLSMSDNMQHEVEVCEPNLGGDYLVTTTPLIDPEGNKYATVHVARDISRLKQTETALRENEERLKLFIEHAPAALAMFDREMRYVNASMRWRSDYGLGGRELIGVCHYEVFPETSEQWKEAHRRGLAGEVLRSEGDCFERADGSVRWIRWEIRPWHAAAGNNGGIVIFADDITAIKEAEEALRRYELLAGHSRDIILFVRCEDGRILEANAAAINIYGYDHKELLELSIDQLRAPGTVELTAAQMAEADMHGILFETVHRRKDGSTFPVEVSSQGATIGGTRTLLSVIRDITERKRAEDALRESEKLVRRKLESIISPEGDIGNLDLADIIDAQSLQAMVDNFYELVGMPMALIDLKGNILVGVGWQDACKLFHRINPDTLRNCIESDLQLTAGVPPGEYKIYKCKNNMWDVATPVMVGDRHFGNLFMGQFFFEEEPLDYEFFRSQARQYGFDEKEYIAALEAVPRMSRDTLDTSMSFFMKLADSLSKQSYSNLKLARSLAERDALMVAMQKSEEQFRTLVDSIPNLAWWANSDGYITWYNRRWYEYTGTTPEQMEGWGWQRVHDPEVLPKVLERWKESLASGQPFEMEFPLRGADGIFRSFLTRVQPVEGSAGQVRRWFGTNTDISALKQAEEEIQRQVAELRVINEELTRFNRLSVGRELRMIELKREINEFCVQTGQAIRYPVDFDEDRS